MWEVLMANMMSPVVMFFVLGLAAALLRSDLKFPSALSDALSMYLLLAIGLKGGIEMSKYPVTELLQPIWGGLLLGTLIPVVTFVMLLKMKIDKFNAAALAAAYGSVSIVTFGAGADFLDKVGASYESYMGAIVAIMEIPAILVSLIMLKALQGSANRQRTGGAVLYSGFLPILRKGIDVGILREVLTGKSILLLAGGLIIGLLAGQEAMPVVQPFFIDPYRGALMLFLMHMGMVCGSKLGELKGRSSLLLGFAVLAPIAYGALGVLVGKAAGLSTGSMMLMGVLAASASYIAAPAAVKGAIPEANPSIYLGLALGVTFPFNLAFGIPLYYWLAQMLA
ncbi:sodium-dependent bicarbonate transport family permease [Paenibacillus abyssi]|uniref:Sodium-dependent bicarbonate transport family permease n=1 Tax=Paenibacillus abyssi TaxID=1340531 RepID=A0A917FNS2_9BACL|nr:sodium-dependent bicarbonate transport family permease [Paenibacillus abyssi]